MPYFLSARKQRECPPLLLLGKYVPISRRYRSAAVPAAQAEPRHHEAGALRYCSHARGSRRPFPCGDQGNNKIKQFRYPTHPKIEDIRVILIHCIPTYNTDNL